MSAGRPTKLTPELQAEICKVLAAGNYLETACAYVGLSRITVRTWMKAGARQKKGHYREFLNAIKKAMAQAELSDVATIKAAAKDQWQAAAWRLERKNYKRWGRKDRQELTGKDGGAVKVQTTQDITDEQLERIIGGAGSARITDAAQGAAGDS